MTSLRRIAPGVLIGVTVVTAGLVLRAQQAPAPDPALVVLPIPDRVEEILPQLKTRDAQVGELIAKGNFPAVYVPAFQAKDLAIALEGKLDAVSPDRRDMAAPAIREIVRLAWLIDAAGDTGNRQQLVAAHDAFSSAVTQLVAAFSN